MGSIGGEAKARLALAAPELDATATGRRAFALKAFKQAIDALFEAESAERAILSVRRLYAIAHRAPLRLATLDGSIVAPPFAPKCAGSGLKRHPDVAVRRSFSQRLVARPAAAIRERKHGADSNAVAPILTARQCAGPA